MKQIYRILYCSLNTLHGSTEQQSVEVEKILASSRRNNARNEITGALLFNSGHWAQVLEGPPAAVEQTFEKIQQDMRHSEISVLECGLVPNRDFPSWSMAHAVSNQVAEPAFEFLNLPNALHNPTSAGAEIGALLRTLVTQDEI